MHIIRRASDQYPTLQGPPAERVHTAMAISQARPVDLPQDRLPRNPTGRFTTLVAWIDHGRWVVGCPSCNSAQMVDPDDPRFFCYVCKNSDNGRAWLKVHFPKPNVIAVIEDILSVRKDESTMNWLPHETVEDLAKENESHGFERRALPQQHKMGVGLDPKDVPAMGFDAYDNRLKHQLEIRKSAQKRRKK